MEPYYEYSHVSSIIWTITVEQRSEGLVGIQRFGTISCALAKRGLYKTCGLTSNVHSTTGTRLKVLKVRDLLDPTSKIVQVRHSLLVWFRQTLTVLHTPSAQPISLCEFSSARDDQLGRKTLTSIRSPPGFHTRPHGLLRTRPTLRSPFD
jgi:hypothetical protein